VKTTKHTQGPWTALYRPAMNLAGVHIRATDKYLEVSYCNSSETETPEADARLMSAAPEMLEALEEFLLCGQNAGHNQRLIEQVKNAIAKAKGGTK